MSCLSHLLLQLLSLPPLVYHFRLTIPCIDSALNRSLSDISGTQWADADYVILVYDVSTKVSFATCSAWFTQVKRANNNKKLKGVLVANKSDLEDSLGEVDSEEAQTWAEKAGLDFIKCNYHDTANFHKALESLAQDYAKSFKASSDAVRAASM